MTIEANAILAAIAARPDVERRAGGFYTTAVDGGARLCAWCRQSGVVEYILEVGETTIELYSSQVAVLLGMPEGMSYADREACEAAIAARASRAADKQ